MGSLVEYTMRSGSASHFPGALDVDGRIGSRNVGCEPGLGKPWLTTVVVRV